MFPNAEVDVIELDPDVVEYSYQYLELDDSINVFIGDGRSVLNSLNKKYDLVINDAFRGYKNIPPHLSTIEFNELVKSKLTENGLYSVNVRGYPVGSYLAASLLKTVKYVFADIKIIDQNSSNTITVASDYSIEFGQDIAPSESGILLTDNRSPTEFLIVADLVRTKLGIK